MCQKSCNGDGNEGETCAGFLSDVVAVWQFGSGTHVRRVVWVCVYMKRKSDVYIKWYNGGPK